MRSAPAQSKAVRQGAAWEARLDAVHREYLRRGLAVMFRSPPPLKVVGPPVRGRLPCVFLAEGPPDYIGSVRVPWHSGMVPLILEAKSTTAARWPLTALTQHQAEVMDIWTTLGSLCAVLLWHGPSAEAWVLPWAGAFRDRWHASDHRNARRAAGSGERASPGLASLGRRDLEILGQPFASDGWYSPLVAMLANLLGG